MASLISCLANTKFRVFRVGDRVAHKDEPNHIHTITRLYKTSSGRKHMDFERSVAFCPTHWSRVKSKIINGKLNKNL